MSDDTWTSRELPAQLAADLGRPALRRWRRELAPELSYNRHAGPARSDARAAAVAIVLCWNGQEWGLPLTVRSRSLTHHRGQVSLPGGLMEPGEKARDAAVRELEEELGVCPDMQWLGELAQLHVFASNALVTPCVAVVDGWPEWRPQPAEVEQVLKLDVRDLIATSATTTLEIERGPLRFYAPQLLVQGHSAWGATAVLLAELRGRLRRAAGHIVREAPPAALS